MPKNIVICCDGTANEFAGDRTNVVKLYYTLEQDPRTQIAFYHPGLGTMEPVGALTTTTRAITRVLGMAMGYGLSNDVRDAYIFLMNNYQENDQVYLFGFSRGSYTARAVCSLLAMYGLIYPGNDPLVPYAVRMMMAIDKAQKRKEQKKGTAGEEDAVAEYFKLARDFKNTMCRTTCNPHFVGVWDTVSSVGWLSDPVKLPFTADNPFIHYGRHAIAIDEKRAFFRTNRWMPAKELTEHGPRDCKQVWFAGVHCDVGGGYAEKDSGLAKIALEWMLEEARAAGLKVNAGRQDEVLGRSPGSTYTAPDVNGMMHESLKGAWKIAEVIEKPHYDYATGATEWRANRGRRRTIPPGSLIHESVFQRQNGAYARDIQLPADAKPVATVRAATV
jgi:uncharacterized protein (DUF2235 family)